MAEYYGIIDSVSVQNIKDVEKLVQEDGAEFLEMTTASVSFVHYPDCQQLSLRLPNNGYDYGSFKFYNTSDSQIIEEVSMMSKLNGNYQVLYDTLGLNPGTYTMELNWKFGCKHIISFAKHEVVEASKATVEASLEPVSTDDATDRSRRVVYDGNLRAATVIYIDGSITLRFSSEMGGGNCFFYILVPTEGQWERYTQTPLRERDDIVQFIAEAMQQKQASGKRFEIDYGQITYYQEGY